MGKGKTWVISTSNARPIAEIAKDLARAGLKQAQVLAEIGTITGSAAASVVPKLRKVAGVTEVAPDVAADVGPPGSSETW